MVKTYEHILNNISPMTWTNSTDGICEMTCQALQLHSWECTLATKSDLNRDPWRRFDVTMQAEQLNGNMFSNGSSRVTLCQVLAFGQQDVPVGKEGHTTLWGKTRYQIKGTINEIASNLYHTQYCIFQVWTNFDTTLWQVRFKFDTPKRFVTNILEPSFC